jgi:hypothetical protein
MGYHIRHMRTMKSTLIAMCLLAIILAGCAGLALDRPQVPPAKPEIIPVKPYPQAVWVPGHWEWKGTDLGYVWFPGHWRKLY